MPGTYLWILSMSVGVQLALRLEIQNYVGSQVDAGGHFGRFRLRSGTALHYSAHDGNAEVPGVRVYVGDSLVPKAAKVLLQAGASAFARNCSGQMLNVPLYANRKL